MKPHQEYTVQFLSKSYKRDIKTGISIEMSNENITTIVEDIIVLEIHKGNKWRRQGGNNNRHHKSPNVLNIKIFN